MPFLFGRPCNQGTELRLAGFPNAELEAAVGRSRHCTTDGQIGIGVPADNVPRVL